MGKLRGLGLSVSSLLCWKQAIGAGGCQYEYWQACFVPPNRRPHRPAPTGKHWLGHGALRPSDGFWRNIKQFTHGYPEHQLEGNDLAQGWIDGRHSIKEFFYFLYPRIQGSMCSQSASAPVPPSILTPSHMYEPLPGAGLRAR